MRLYVSAIAVLLAACSAQDSTAPEPDDSAPQTTVDDDVSADTGSEVGEAGQTEAQLDASSEDESVAGGSASEDNGGNVMAAIPANFRGTWAATAEDCAARNFNRLTIAADRISFFEDGGIASDIRGDRQAAAITYPFETPDGNTERRVVYLARETADRIRVRQGDSESKTHIRCK